MNRSRILAVIPSACLTLTLVGIGAAGADPQGVDPGTRVARGEAVTAPRAPTPPSSAITIGSPATNVDGSCPTNLATKMGALDGATGTYTVPRSGVLTSFSYNAGVVGGSITLLMLSPTPTVDLHDVVARSSAQTVTPNMLNTFPIRMPVQTGWQLGSATGASNMNCVYVGTGADIVNYDASFLPADTQASTTNDLGGRVNIAAVLEPDADSDGYGDVSQDLCPQVAATQADCPPPNTTITKAPPRKTTKRKVLLRFSSAPGATYTCAIDGAAAGPCSSPFRKRLSLGKHLIVVTATSSAGIPDPTPPTVRFKIVKAPASSG